MARRSAWGPPSGAVAPSATMCPSSTMSAPTIGFGWVVPQTLRARKSARRMYVSCSTPDIRVVCAFVCHGGFRSVAGEHDGVSGQSVDLLADRVFELLEISPRQIRPPDAAVEQGIADECGVRGGEIKQDVARTMPWHMPDLD